MAMVATHLAKVKPLAPRPCQVIGELLGHMKLQALSPHMHGVCNRIAALSMAAL